MKYLYLILTIFISTVVKGQQAEDIDIHSLQTIRNANVSDAEQIALRYGFLYDTVLQDGTVYKFINDINDTELYFSVIDSKIGDAYIVTNNMKIYDSCKNNAKVLKAKYIKTYNDEANSVYHLYEKGDAQIIFSISRKSDKKYFILVKGK